MKIQIKILVVISLILCFTPVILNIIFSERIIIGEVPCVDELNRVNLEGIMCEDIRDYTFGIKETNFFLLSAPLSIIGLLLFSFALEKDSKMGDGKC